MKRSIIITVLLLILTAGIAIGASWQVNGTADDVEVSETVLYGDKSAAEGISLTFHATWGNHLFWNTEYQVGDMASVHTDYHFSQEYEDTDSWVQLEDFAMDFYTGFGIYREGIDLEQEDLGMGYQTADDKLSLKRLVESVAAKTGNGEVHSERVLLKNYCDWCPVQVYTFGGRMEYISESDRQAMADYFRLPVPENQELLVTTGKSSSGEINQVEVMAMDDSGAETICTVAEKGIYLMIQGDAFNHVSAEESQAGALPGPGIYYVPFKSAMEKESGNGDYSGESEVILPGDETDSGEMIYGLDTARIRRCYASDQKKMSLINPHLSTDGDQFLFYGESLEDGSLTMIVIDTDTLEIVQELRLAEKSGAGIFLDKVRSFPDYQVVFYGETSEEEYCKWAVMLLTKDARGKYEKQIEADFTECALELSRAGLSEDTSPEEDIFEEELNDGENIWLKLQNRLANDTTAIDYDGKRMVLAGNGWGSGDISFAVCDRSGVRYLGEYEYSIVSRDANPEFCRLLDEQVPLEVKLPR